MTNICVELINEVEGKVEGKKKRYFGASYAPQPFGHRLRLMLTDPSPGRRKRGGGRPTV